MKNYSEKLHYLKRGFDFFNIKHHNSYFCLRHFSNGVYLLFKDEEHQPNVFICPAKDRLVSIKFNDDAHGSVNAMHLDDIMFLDSNFVDDSDFVNDDESHYASFNGEQVELESGGQIPSTRLHIENDLFH